MKKILAIMAMMVAFMATSCKEKVTVLYDVTGTADGQVEFTWPNGSANVDGHAVIVQCNDTTKVKEALLKNVKGIRFSDALVSNDVELNTAAQETLKLFGVKGVDGKYHFTLKGYVWWGPFKLEIDEEYPKVDDTVVVEEVSEEVTE